MSEPVVYFVYELHDPRSPAWNEASATETIALGLHPQAFYVGKSKSTVDRLAQHIGEARSGGAGWRSNVIRKILASGQKPSLARVAEFSSEGDALAAEYGHASRFPGGRLTNLAVAGESGWSHGPETRAQMSRAHTGRIRSPEQIERARLLRLPRTKLGVGGREAIVHRLLLGESPATIALDYVVTTAYVETIRRDARLRGEMPPIETARARFLRAADLVSAGTSPAGLAEALGCSLLAADALVHRARREGLVPDERTWPRESTRRGRRALNIVAASNLRAEGVFLKDIVLRLEMEESRVVGLLRDARVALSDGLTVDEMAAEFNTSAEIARSVLAAAARIEERRASGEYRSRGARRRLIQGQTIST